MNPNEKFTKVVFFGYTSVGKTTIIRQEIKSNEQDEGQTVGANSNERSYNIDGKEVLLQIWDTAGQERFKSLSQLHYLQAAIAILVYSVIDKKSLTKFQAISTRSTTTQPISHLSLLLGIRQTSDRKTIQNISRQRQGKSSHRKIRLFLWKRACCISRVWMIYFSQLLVRFSS